MTYEPSYYSSVAQFLALIPFAVGGGVVLYFLFRIRA